MAWAVAAFSVGQALVAPTASADASPAGYTTQGSCAGYPRLPLQTPKGWCAGLVADARDGLRMPRRLLEVAPGVFWITDMGNWEPHRGRLLALNIQGQPGEPGRIKPLVEHLDRPHGLALGPDGKVYIGEAGRIWRTPVANPIQRETLLKDLPADGAHPLKEIAFGQNGQLWFNMGSATDACRHDAVQPQLPCPETSGPQPRAAVYLATLGGPDFALQSVRPYATGLRNSLGLAAVPASSTQDEQLWQAENSVDYSDANAPAEELNALKDGSQHGWPTCVSDRKGRAVVARGYEGRASCTAAQAPHQAWPAHAAPLQLMYVTPASAPKSPWANHLLSAWHGYRAQGQRIVGWALTAEGAPQTKPEVFVSGWEAKPGIRPLGAPAGITVDSQGRLWIVEDRNHTVILIAPDPANSAAPR